MLHVHVATPTDQRPIPVIYSGLKDSHGYVIMMRYTLSDVANYKTHCPRRVTLQLRRTKCASDAREDSDIDMH